MVHPLYLHDCSGSFLITNPSFNSLKSNISGHPQFFHGTSLAKARQRRRLAFISSELDEETGKTDFPAEKDEVNNPGVKAALSMLRFYKREISPLMPNSCRYVPTCSEYSMIAYKKYGVAKGTILTAWRLCRCNPLGGSGFDPPRWFGEASIPDE